ncbi:MAG TPA: hypothetical protein VFY26_08190, partial [Anaerolineales bacterium]|nr:hypothetical protein [Anaerolineales bacterium]
RVRAAAWRDVLGQGEVVSSQSTVGGGSLPEESLPTFVLALNVSSTDKFLKRLREADPPIVARVENDTILFDPRTVLDDEALVTVLQSLLSEKP